MEDMWLRGTFSLLLTVEWGAVLVGLGAAFAGIGSILTGMAALRTAKDKGKEEEREHAKQTSPVDGD